MKIDSIFEMWEQDSPIDRQRLDEAALNISSLHAKYHRIYTNERLVLRKYEGEMAELKLQKYEFYTQGPTKETVEKGWQLPPIGKIIKSDVGAYMEADRDIIHMNLKLGLQHEKISLLESIIKNLQNRGYNIRAAVDYIRFIGGA